MDRLHIDKDKELMAIAQGVLRANMSLGPWFLPAAMFANSNQDQPASMKLVDDLHPRHGKLAGSIIICYCDQQKPKHSVLSINPLEAKLMIMITP